MIFRLLNILKTLYKPAQIAVLLSVFFCLNAFAHSVHISHQSVEQDVQSNQAIARESIDTLFQRYSQTGDDSLLKQARQQLETSLHGKSPKIEDLIHAAWLAQAEHKFGQALLEIDEVLRQQPNHTQAWILKSSVLTVMGEVEAARTACIGAGSNMSIMLSLACQARLESEPPGQQRALAVLSKLLKLDLHHNDAERAWVLATTADLAFELENYQQAVHWYGLANDKSTSVQIRAALADALMAIGAEQEVLKLINHHETAPALAVRRMLAESKSGIELSHQIQTTDVLFKRWIEQGDFRHAREMAFFYIKLKDDPQLAKFLAEVNIKNQREREDTELFELTRIQLTEDD